VVGQACHHLSRASRARSVASGDGVGVSLRVPAIAEICRSARPSGGTSAVSGATIPWQRRQPRRTAGTTLVDDAGSQEIPAHAGNGFARRGTARRDRRLVRCLGGSARRPAARRQRADSATAATGGGPVGLPDGQLHGPGHGCRGSVYGNAEADQESVARRQPYMRPVPSLMKDMSVRSFTLQLVYDTREADYDWIHNFRLLAEVEGVGTMYAAGECPWYAKDKIYGSDKQEIRGNTAGLLCYIDCDG